AAAAPWTARLSAHAERDPGRVALVTSTATLTYGELAARAEALRVVLAGHGAGPGSVVALALPRTADLVVALAATGLAGAAYLPVDTGYPADRIAYLLTDAAPKVLLTTRALAPGLPLPSGAGLLLVDEPGTWTAPATGPAGVDPDSPAYLIYTSGSTGRPKGVIVSHRSFATFLASFVEAVGISSADRVLAATTLAFDPSTVELIAPLTVGGCVHLVDGDAARDPAVLAGLLGSGAVTLAQATPTRWRSVLDAAPGPFPGPPPLQPRREQARGDHLGAAGEPDA
ncbi:AMP-binding protein, partial [Frankia sp. AgKG'84/4]|uniref:AMP-binding protein n=1 Tax=Frankia sp. AgKG'84/4 TaxID=573490 RepID=UPI00202AC068